MEAVLKDEKEWPMPFKDNLLFMFSQRRQHVMPHRATGETSGFSQESKAGTRRKPSPESLQGFL